MNGKKRKTKRENHTKKSMRNNSKLLLIGRN